MLTSASIQKKQSISCLNDVIFRRYSFEDAISNLRHLYHPTTYNCPNGMVFAKIELDMRGSKKVKSQDFQVEITAICCLAGPLSGRIFQDGANYEVLRAEYSGSQRLRLCQRRGSENRGSSKWRQNGRWTRVDHGDFQRQNRSCKSGEWFRFVLCDFTDFFQADIDNFIGHTELLKAMKPLVGLLRDKMPSVINGTIGDDVPLLIKKFGKGMEVEIKKVKPALGTADEPDYGYCVASIGEQT